MGPAEDPSLFSLPDEDGDENEDAFDDLKSDLDPDPDIDPDVEASFWIDAKQESHLVARKVPRKQVLADPWLK